MYSYYDILEVKPDASQSEIKASYRRLIKLYHPDKNLNAENATQKTQLLNEAFSTLKNPVKRYEYDSRLNLNNEPKTHADTNYKQQTSTDIPHYYCEKCGRQDPTLRVTVFLWVVSLFYVTWKRGKGNILCAKCRIKYSILWNLEVWIAGWWGFPFGPIYSIEALYKNSKGGVQSETNNAKLLTVLAYDFYKQGRYEEAYDSLQESQRLKPTKENEEFLTYLKSYTISKSKSSIFQTIINLNTLWYNIPFLTLLLFLSFSALTSINWETNQPLKGDRYVPTSKSSPINSEPSKSELRTQAAKLGIDMGRIDNSARICNNAISIISAHIKNKVPFIGTTYEGTIRIDNYELDRSKLDNNIIHIQSEIIHNELIKVSKQLKSFRESLLNDLNKSDSLKIRIYNIIKSQYYAIAETYFNSAILEYSIPVVNQFYSNNQIPKSVLLKLIELKEEPNVSAWLKESSYSSAFNYLFKVIQNIQNINTKLSKIKSEMNLLKIKIDNAEKEIQSYNSRLNYYKDMDMTQEYNKLVNKYNANLALDKKMINKYNLLADDYIATLKKFADTDLDGAFNDCLNTQILFADYEKINLKSERNIHSNYER